MLSNTNLVVGFFNASHTVIGSTLIRPCPKKLEKQITQLWLGCHWNRIEGIITKSLQLLLLSRDEC